MSGRLSVAGSLLAGRYTLEEVLGKGSMGAVYRARDERLHQPCAVKLLHRLVDEQDEHYGRFATEAAAITQLFHPNIVQVREFGQDASGLPFLVMEFLRGRDLYSLLQERPRLSLLQTLDILRQVGSALHCAHSQGIVHRDIKPKNLFLSRQTNAYGEEFEVVKVVDFGLSKFIGRRARSETGLGTLLGTPEYMSPESTLGVSSAVDYRTDQWALGVMAYRLLSGRLPFDHEDLVRLMVQIREQTPAPLARLLPNLPPHVDAAIRRALSKKKEERFATVQDFVRALDGLPSAHLAMQPAAPSAGAPTLLLPQVAMPGTVLSVPEPVLYELSKRLRVASLPTAAVAVPASRGEGAKKAESPLQTRRSPPLALQRPRRPTPALSPWRAVAALVLGAGLSLLGTLAVGRRGSREAVEGVNKVAPGPRPTEPAPMPPPSEPGGQGATADRAQAGRASPASPASPASSKHGRGGARPTRWGSGRSEGNLALVIPYAQAMPPKPEPAPPGDRAEAEVTPKATLAPAESPPRVSMVD